MKMIPIWLISKSVNILKIISAEDIVHDKKRKKMKNMEDESATNLISDSAIWSWSILLSDQNYIILVDWSIYDQWNTPNIMSIYKRLFHELRGDQVIENKKKVLWAEWDV